MLADIFFKINDIELQVNPRAKVDYSVKMGRFENEIPKAQIEALREERKLVLAQARTNRGDTIVDAKPEENLQKKFTQ